MKKLIYILFVLLFAQLALADSILLTKTRISPSDVPEINRSYYQCRVFSDKVEIIKRIGPVDNPIESSESYPIKTNGNLASWVAAAKHGKIELSHGEPTPEHLSYVAIVSNSKMTKYVDLYVYDTLIRENQSNEAYALRKYIDLHCK